MWWASMADRSVGDDPWVVVEAIAAGALVVGVMVTAPFVALLVGSGSTGGLSAGDALVGTARIASEGHWADPALAFPRGVGQHMPGALGWWAATAVVAATVVGFGAWVWRRVDAHVSRASIARRPYDARGSRQRVWARPRDLADSTSRGRRPGRFTLGRLDGRLIVSQPESHVALIAPTRSGKTTRHVIPWLLEHDGPAIATSTKLDVVEATEKARRRRGKVWVWDPFGPESAGWSPLQGCDEWSYALAQARWMADASGEGDSEIAAYWRGEAAKVLAPLLHAAALDGQAMDSVLAWVDAQEILEPSKVLNDGGCPDGVRQLGSITKLDDRNRGTTYMSAGSLLAAYRYPQLAKSNGEFTLEAFLDGGPHTLYVVASARHQRLLAPLVVGLISSVLHEAAERTRRDEALSPTLRLLLDETANIAPLRDLPAHLSQAAGNGVRIATIWQSLAQVSERYGRAADSILANSTTKLFMGPVTDERTRRYVQGLVGEEAVTTRSRTDAGAFDGGGGRSTRTRSHVMRPAASAPELQQLGADRALLVEGAHKPAIVATRPWWDDRQLLKQSGT